MKGDLIAYQALVGQLFLRLRLVLLHQQTELVNISLIGAETHHIRVDYLGYDHVLALLHLVALNDSDRLQELQIGHF